MRMLKPDPGEVYDRIAILELKIHYGVQKGVDTTAFRDEQISLADYVVNTYPPAALSHPDLAVLCRGAYEINLELWKLEDEIRLLQKQDRKNLKVAELERVIDIAFLIPMFNDRRMNVVKKINELFGIRRQEKLY